MIENEAAKLKRIYYMLLSALVVLMLTQLAGILMSSVYYLVGIVLSIIISGARFAYLKRKDAATLRKVMVVFVFLMAIAGPVIFTILKLIFSTDSFFTFQMLSLVTFILPIALLLLAIKSIQNLLENQQGMSS